MSFSDQMVWRELFVVLSNIIIALETTDGQIDDIRRVKLGTFKLLYRTLKIDNQKVKQFTCSKEFLKALSLPEYLKS